MAISRDSQTQRDRTVRDALSESESEIEWREEIEEQNTWLCWIEDILVLGAAESSPVQDEA